jgi:hypothetical protein
MFPPRILVTRELSSSREDVISRRSLRRGNLAGCEGELSDGFIFVSGQQLSLVPIPSNSLGPVGAAFVFKNGSSLKVNAASVYCSCFGPSKYVEEFPG